MDFDGSDTTSERPLGKQTFNVTTGPTIGRMSNLREGKVEESWVFFSFFVPDFIPCLFQSHCVCVPSQWTCPIHKKNMNRDKKCKAVDNFW